MRRVLHWLVLIVIAVVVLLGGLELILQTGAWWVRATGREAPVARITDELRVLCLGDSNTYGVYLDRAQSWPSQLEAGWNEPGPSPRMKVYNLGFPGTNSSKVLADFARMVETFRPHVIIVMVGANDFWTVPSRLAESDGSPQTLLELVERRSRLYRLAFMLYRERTHAGPQALELERSSSEGEPGVERGELVFGDEVFEFITARNESPAPMSASRQRLNQNLWKIVHRAREKNTPLLLMSYPAQQNHDLYSTASRELKRVAERSRTPFLDLRALFAERCSDPECRELLFPDEHPNAAGYRIVASEVSRKLAELLAE